MSSQKRLLIVDNDHSLVELLERNFTKLGYSVTPLGLPKQALEAIETGEFDVALLDGNLPDHDGIWLMQELKKKNDIAVIILSAHTDEAFKQRALASGACAYLCKPCSLTDLESAVANAMDPEIGSGLENCTTGKPFERLSERKTGLGLLLLLTLAAALCVGCSNLMPSQAESNGSVNKKITSSSTQSRATQTSETSPENAVCVIRPIGDSNVAGTLNLRREGNEIRIQGEISGLKPGVHGFHIHEYGDLTDSVAGKSAGGHFNPDDQPHGAPDAEKRHVGDLGNITADTDGKATIDIRDKRIKFSGTDSIIGRAILIHAGADKFSQPSGDAGARVGFGVIGIAAKNQ